MKLSTKNVKTTSLTLEILFTHLSIYDLWSHYLGYQIVLNKKIISPIREERNPSAVLFSINNTILLKDFYPPGEVFTIWKYLKYKYNWSFYESLKQIDLDFNLGYFNHRKTNIKKVGIKYDFIIKENTDTRIEIKRGKWSNKELNFWLDYFTKETLDILPIKPISHYWIQKDDNLYEFARKENELLFAFIIENYYKIYRPNSKLSKNKWYSNIPCDILMGENLLPWIGETLIITKGMKELGILKEFGYNTVALQGESCYLNSLKLNTLKHRFNTIYSLMDLDKAGLIASKYLETLDIMPINLPQSFIQENPDHKDLGEIRKFLGYEKTFKLVHENIKKREY